MNRKNGARSPETAEFFVKRVERITGMKITEIPDCDEAAHAAISASYSASDQDRRLEYGCGSSHGKLYLRVEIQNDGEIQYSSGSPYMVGRGPELPASQAGRWIFSQDQGPIHEIN